ncbi:MAG: hypothetical protein IKQ20_06010, partial [Bacteroidales bacterium]|nr:hypothetical protein [Bacteroidales bacterium]
MFPADSAAKIQLFFKLTKKTCKFFKNYQPLSSVGRGTATANPSNPSVGRGTATANPSNPSVGRGTATANP